MPVIERLTASRIRYRVIQKMRDDLAAVILPQPARIGLHQMLEHADLHIGNDALPDIIHQNIFAIRLAAALRIMTTNTTSGISISMCRVFIDEQIFYRRVQQLRGHGG